jgi:hypothetical protein
MGRRRGRGAGERGSILIDYFVGVSFFLVTLGVFLELTRIKVAASGEAERRMRAVAAAESRIAELRAGAAAAGGFEVAAIGGRGEVSVKPRDDGLRDAAVVVRWRERRGREESVQLTTVLGQ